MAVRRILMFVLLAASLCGCASEVDRALVKAAAVGNVNDIRRLLDEGADPDAIAFEWTPLTAAAYWGKSEAVRALLAGGAQVDRNGPGGATALYWAVQQNQLEIIRLLLEAGAQPTSIKGARGLKRFWEILDDPGKQAAKTILHGKGFRPN